MGEDCEAAEIGSAFPREQTYLYSHELSGAIEGDGNCNEK